jgi:uncharacterized membrane protein (UPF0127 family)
VSEPAADLSDLPENLPPFVRSAVETSATASGRKRLWWVIGGLLFLAALAFLAVGANGPADPELVGPAQSTTTTVPRVRFGDFGESALRVQAANTTLNPAVTPFCVLVAASDAQRAQGLMERPDLGGYDGMLFQFPSPTRAKFHMRNTPLPLTIAFFDREGTFVSSADLAPCGNRRGCPQYGASAPYLYALEVPQGGLARLQIAPGSRVFVGGTCT